MEAILLFLAKISGLYSLLPGGLKDAVEATTLSLYEQVVQKLGADAAMRLTGSREEQRVRRAFAKAVGLTLAKHSGLHAVAIASDFRRPPLSEQVLRLLEDPNRELVEGEVRSAFAMTPYDLGSIGVDEVELLAEIRESFLRLLREDPRTRDLWSALVLEQMQRGVDHLVADGARVLRRQLGGSPLLAPEVHFGPWLRPGRVFSHEWGLVGREDHLDALVRFGSGVGAERVAILPGRGGIGKTRLLLAVTRTLTESRPEGVIRVAAEGQPVNAEDLVELPADALVILDDAHRRADLEPVLSAALRTDRVIRILVSCRPYGVDRITATVARAGYDSAERLILPELQELGREGTVALARQALGQGHEHLAEALAAATGESPLVTVWGARLLAEEALNPALLAHHAEFRRDVLARMADEYAASVGDLVDRPLAIRILELVAALGSVPLSDADLLTRAAEFLEITNESLRRALAGLQDAGVLIASGDAVRITPDVLGDYLYFQAAVANGQPTGFVDRVYAEFGGLATPQVIIGLAELDWRARMSDAPRIDLLEAVWNSFVEEMKGASNFDRVHLLGSLKDVAVYQPRRVLEVVDLLMDDEEERKPSEAGFGNVTWDHQRVLAALPPLLRRIAYHPDHRNRALDLLWQLGRDDERPKHNHPDHPVRTLAELASYDLPGRLELSTSILERARHWLQAPDVYQHRHSVLDVVDPVLAKAGSTSRWEGVVVTFHPYFVDPKVTAPIRSKALSIVDEVIGSTRVGAIVRAVKSLASALQPPRGQFGATASDELVQSWLPERRLVLDRIEALVAQGQDPIVTVEVASALSWECVHGPDEEIRQRAREVVGSIRWSFEFGMALHMGSYPHRLRFSPSGVDFEEITDFSAREERRESDSAELVDEFAARFTDPETGADWLDQRLTVMADAEIDAMPGSVLASLGARHPEYGAELARWAIARSASRLAPWIGGVLVGMRKVAEKETIAVAEQFAQSDAWPLRAAAAQVCRAAARSPGINDQWTAMLRMLLADEEERVVLNATHALLVLSHADWDLGLSLALEVDPGYSKHVADGVLGAVLHARGERVLGDGAIEALLSALKHIHELEGHWIMQFLREASDRLPRSVVSLVLNRARHEKEHGTKDFRALPYHFESTVTGFGDVPDRAPLLREIRDLSLEGEGHVPHWLPRLFRAVSHQFDEVGREVLQEWIDQEEPRRLEAVAHLLAAAEWRFFVEDHAFVTGLLLAAASQGSEVLEYCSDVLRSSAARRGGERRLGDESQEDVEARDRAAEIAESLPAGSVQRKFYEDVASDARASIERWARFDEGL